MTYYIRETYPESIFLKRMIAIIFFSIIYFPSFFGKPDTNGNLFFNHLTVNNGLSQNSITSILQDSKGLIWIGSYDGLNRFDGFSTIVKRHDPGKPNSLTENRILCLAETKDGEIWIGTEGGGINLYNPGSECFINYTEEKNNLPSNNIFCICPDTSDNLWIGTGKGLTFVNRNNKKNIRFKHIELPGGVLKICADQKGNLWLISNPGLYLLHIPSAAKEEKFYLIPIDMFLHTYIYTVFCDSSDNVWIATFNGLFQIKNKEKKLHPVDLYATIFAKKNVIIRTMVEDRDGNIWIGTEKSGLFKLSFDPAGNVSETIHYHTDIPFCNISDNSIRALYVDRTNVLWIGFHKKGVNYADICYKKFNLLIALCHPVMSELGYKGKFTSLTFCDSKNRVWIVCEEEGLFVYDRLTENISFITNHPFSETITSVIESRSGDFWLGGHDRLFNIKKQHSDNKHYLLNDVLYQAGTGIIRTLCEDIYGDIWFGSITGKGLYRYNLSNGQLDTYTTKDSIFSEKIFYLYPDKKEAVLWVGTLDGGLIRVQYNSKNREIQPTTYTTNSNLRLISNHIWHIYEDSSNRLWIGTDAGLNEINLDEKRNVTTIASIEHPLLNSIKIMAITEDLDHNFWLNCTQGLYYYNPVSDIVKIYTYEDGLQSNTFTEAASVSNDGWIFSGGINGTNYFLPQQIKDNPYDSQVAIVDFRIHGKTVKPGEKNGNKIILNQDINDIEAITLDHRNNNFMFEFVATHYAVAQKNRFLYKLDGFDNHWISTDSKLRVASYSNLPAGKYNFLIKASNNDGVWSENIKQILITILPSPWKTAWAYALYLLALFGLIYFVIHYLLTKQKLKHELQVERIEKEKMNEINEMRMNFFTNITHEFRTPLALILSPLKDLLVEAKKQNRYVQLRLQIINRNALRLLNLINQTLDIRKMSSGNMSLLITPNNLRIQVENMIESFGFLAKDQMINVEFINNLKQEIQWYDKYKIDKILLNILSNAFKFAPKNGCVTIRIEQQSENENEFALISVKNTGKGIPQADLNKIFEPFYQVHNESTTGTGIGLSYVKSLLELHQGNIYVISKENEETCFTFRFPMNRSAYNESVINEIIDVDSFSQPVIPYLEEETDKKKINDDNLFSINENANKNENTKRILIVEDNVDLRMYIKDCLSKHYEVLVSSNGMTGLELARKEFPDLIITDIIMPVMGGIEFCKAIKSDLYTKHIPVIVHSVKMDEIAMKEAMNAGAEDFIGKPFNYTMLIKKINNFFKTREHLIVRIHAEKILEPGKVEIPSSDDELIRKVSIAIENNLSNPDFNIDVLAKIIGLSRMQLHRRIISITNKQTSYLIRDIRLQKAAQLLDSGEKRISEVMWETGFNNHSRFNNYFKEKYGLSPKDYINSSLKK
jgi:signal transduction histidine kinase/ligand-binding sensor domain-containing protein/DNA-binding response OmpR family regulator